MYPKVLNQWRMIIGNGRFLFGVSNVNNSLALFSDSSLHGAVGSASNSIFLNVWQHICGVRLSDGTTSIYINGIQSGASGNSGTPVTGYGLAIGAGDLFGDYIFNGLIDEVRIYNRALSATEVQELYNYTGGGTPTPTPSATPSPTPTPTPSGTPTPTPTSTPIPTPSPTPDTTPPIRSLGSPSGTLAAGTTQTTLSLSTNENATCRYSTNSGIAYSSMTNTFSTTGTQSHSTTATGLQNGNTYNYYARCQDSSGNANPDDYIISFSISLPGTGEIIPSNRRLTWQGNVGVVGGIPARTSICATLGVPGQAPSYTQSVTASQITSAISSCTPGQTVYLNPGTYTLSQSIVMSSNVTLRGAGPNQTILKATSSFGNYQGLVRFANCSWPYEYSAINVTSGYTKGSTQIVVADASTISIGDIIRIDELNDASVPVSQVGDNGTCTWCDPHTAQNGSRIRMQILKVTNKLGNTLTLEIPLYWTFSSGNSPQVWKPICTITSNAGVEDLQLWNASSGDNNSAFLWGTDSCWLKNVKTINAGQYGLYIYNYNYRTEIRQCELTGYAPTTDDTYTLIVNGCSAVLVEDNISHNTGSSVIMGWGASGNVFAYNYAINTHRTYNQTGWFWPDAWEHSSHTGFNLYEGNMGTALAFDATWGSHSNNTVFRNRYTSKNLDISYISSVQGVVAFAAMAKSSSMNVIGNILGSSGWNNHYERSAEAFNPGVEKNIYELGLWAPLGSGGPNDTPTTRSTLLRHGNYDYYNNSQKWCDDIGEPGCQGGNASHNFPNSYYLASAPPNTWWCAESAWPSVDPFGPTVSDIPAKRRYDGAACTLGGFPPSDTTPPAAPTGVTVN